MKTYCYLLGIFCLVILPACRHSAPVSQQQSLSQQSVNTKETQALPETKATSEEEELNELTADGVGLSRVPKVKETRKDEQPSVTGNTEEQPNTSDIVDELNDLTVPSNTDNAQQEDTETPATYKEEDATGTIDSPPKTDDKPQGGNQLPDLDLSPAAVAEYLIITGDFKGFDVAVTDLIKTGVMTSEEAVQYKNRVGLELESLLQEAENELLEDKEEDGLETPVAPWTSYNWPVYDSPLDERAEFEPPRQRRNMADDSQDQLVLAQLIDRVVSEYAHARDRAAYEQRLNEEDTQAQALLDMLLAKQRAGEVEPSSYIPLPVNSYKAQVPQWLIDNAAQQNKVLPQFPQPQEQTEFTADIPENTEGNKVEQTAANSEATTVKTVADKNSAKSEEKTH